MKNSKIIFLASVALIVVLSLLFAIKKPENPKNNSVPPKEQPVLLSQTNTEGIIEVTATPKDLSSSSSWDFEVILTTHSGSLDQDLTKSAVLIDDKGNRFVPTAWEGDPPGGHHRSGVLKFKPIAPTPQFVKLEINRVGSGKKVFEWVLQ